MVSGEIPNFFYTPEILNYDFGPQHPLKPERLRRTIELLGRYGLRTVEPKRVGVGELGLVHDPEYIEAVRQQSDNPSPPALLTGRGEGSYGFGPGDNPPFRGMYEASMAYVSASVSAAEKVAGGAMLAFGIGGGLHHAHRNRASGFCIFDDPAIACAVLRERFERVAYVDIDVHHGDGVQWIFYNDPQVLTCSIHEEGRTLFPGTGFTDETGAEFTSFNVPMQAKTTGDVWLDAFERTIIPALEAWQPQAIVLQMGTDTHYLDPLGHLRCTQEEWLAAIIRVKDLGLPIVALGGGGYNLTTVPRMWASAVLTLSGVEYEDEVPDDLAEEWEMPTFSDEQIPAPREIGRDYAEAVISELGGHVANLRRS